MRVVNKKEILEIEKASFGEFGLTKDLVIEGVGREISDFILENFIEDLDTSSFIFLIGAGNNGADGLAAARNLSNKGLNVRVFFIAGNEKLSDELKIQMDRAKAFEVRGNEIDDAKYLESFLLQNSQQNIIIDAISGTGVRLPLAEKVYDFINVINENSDFTISIDLPSGVDTNSGKVQGTAVKADITLSIGFPKIGCFIGEGVNYIGQIENLEIGFSHKLKSGDKELADLDQVVDIARLRSKFEDKKSFGHTLLLGGSHGLTGSLVMASEAALRVGVGVVTAATWEPQYLEFVSRLIPEIKTGYIPLDDSRWGALVSDLEKYDSIVIGPGLGVSARSRRLVHKILESYQGPVVLDADAINVLSIKDDLALLQNRRNPTILTPHFGEMAKFFKVEKSKIHAEPIKYLKQAVDQTNALVVLKGPCTFLGFPSGQVYLNYSPNSGMASGGVGDVLAGILGGFAAQDHTMKKNISRYEKIVSLDKTVLLGVMMHSRAGYFASQDLGDRYMTATSIINSLPKAFEEIK